MIPSLYKFRRRLDKVCYHPLTFIYLFHLIPHTFIDLRIESNVAVSLPPFGHATLMFGCLARILDRRLGVSSP
jgi:hypothetical protein